MDGSIYRLGVKLFELGTVVLANMDLHREAQSFVEALTTVTGEAVPLCVFNGLQTTLIRRGQPARERANTVVVMEASRAIAGMKPVAKRAPGRRCKLSATRQTETAGPSPII